jgi:eukaryotic-like serine/threonine-protein kinase
MSWATLPPPEPRVMDRLPPSARVTEPVPIRLPRGTVLGRYAVDGWVREGGMAALYRGHHVQTGAKVAIKVQRSSDEDDATVAARFVREGEVMGRLSGVPNVVQVHDMGALPDGRRYLVMEWIDGDNLEELLDGLRNTDASLSIERACRLVADVALALAAAHRASVVHRDVKPSNVMIDRSLADREVAKLLDFGISADLGAGGHGVDLTATGVVLGTSGYVAPEQALGLPADPAFDVYALGVVLFEAITGRAMPPEGLGPLRLPPLRQLRAGVPAELEVLVERCMSRDPSQRPASAGEVAEVLAAVRAERGAGASMAIGAAASASGVVVAEASAAAVAVAEASGVRPGATGAAVSPWWWGLGGFVLVGALGWWALASQGPSGSAATNEVGGASAAIHTAADATGSTTGAGPAAIGDGSHAGGSTGLGTLEGGPETESSGSESGEASTTESGAPPPIQPARCRRVRSEAEAAVARRDWQRVIRASTDRACWSSSAQRLDRKAMRVKAWLELERYERCVGEGTGETEPRVARLTKYCREKLAGGGG